MRRNFPHAAGRVRRLAVTPRKRNYWLGFSKVTSATATALASEQAMYRRPSEGSQLRALGGMPASWRVVLPLGLCVAEVFDRVIVRACLLPSSWHGYLALEVSLGSAMRPAPVRASRSVICVPYEGIRSTCKNKVHNAQSTG